MSSTQQCRGVYGLRILLQIVYRAVQVGQRILPLLCGLQVQDALMVVHVTKMLIRATIGLYMTMQDRIQVAHFVTRCEEVWSIKFMEGKNHNISFMAHLWEPLRVYHKPLVVHLFSELAGATNRLWLLMLGFRMQQHKVCSGSTHIFRIIMEHLHSLRISDLGVHINY